MSRHRHARNLIAYNGEKATFDLVVDPTQFLLGIKVHRWRFLIQDTHHQYTLIFYFGPFHITIWRKRYARTPSSSA